MKTNDYFHGEKIYFPGRSKKIFFSLDSLKEISGILFIVSQRGDSGIRRFLILLSMAWNYKPEQSLTRREIQSLVEHHFPGLVEIKSSDLAKLRTLNLLIEGKYFNTYILTPKGNWVAFILSQLLATLPNSDFWMAKKRFDMILSWTGEGDAIGDFESLQQLLRSIIESIYMNYRSDSNETYGESLEQLRREIIEQVDIHLKPTTNIKDFAPFSKLRQELTKAFSIAWKRESSFIKRKIKLSEVGIYPDDVQNYLKSATVEEMARLIEFLPFLSSKSLPIITSTNVLKWCIKDEKSSQRESVSTKVHQFSVPILINNVNEIPKEYRPNQGTLEKQEEIYNHLSDFQPIQIQNLIENKEWEDSNAIIRAIKDLEIRGVIKVALKEQIDEIKHQKISRIRNGLINKA